MKGRSTLIENQHQKHLRACLTFIPPSVRFVRHNYLIFVLAGPKHVRSRLSASNTVQPKTLNKVMLCYFYIVLDDEILDQNKFVLIETTAETNGRIMHKLDDKVLSTRPVVVPDISSFGDNSCASNIHDICLHNHIKNPHPRLHWVGVKLTHVGSGIF